MSDGLYAVTVVDSAAEKMTALTQDFGRRCGRLAAQVTQFAEKGAQGSCSIIAIRDRTRVCFIPVFSEIGSGNAVGALLLVDDRMKTISVECIYGPEERFDAEEEFEYARDLLRSRA